MQITRMLRSRLEIAQFKVGRSWQNLPFKTVEPQLEREARMRNPEAFQAVHEHNQSPPLPAQGTEFLVPNLPARGRIQEPVIREPTPVSAIRANVANQTRQGTSPLKRRRSDSSERELSELGSSPLKYHASNSNLRERQDHITPPPSTPPPMHMHMRSSHTHTSKADTEEGADLLLYLATSPSPAKSRRTNRGLDYSSPPPMRGSSAVNTPVGAGFNLSEFLNFSPSPATLPRGRFDANKFSPAKLTYDDSPSRLASRQLEGV